jgi:hypothetical protein
MSDQKPAGLPFDGTDPAERELWNLLGELGNGEPSPRLRRKFYARLHEESRPGLAARLRAWLGFRGNGGWATAAVCLLAGIGAGHWLDSVPGDGERRLAALEQNVSMLNRTLVLDRLENDQASKRLRGAIDAAFLADDDAEVARALLQRATEDRVSSVRAAAIEALGSQLDSPAIGARIMDSIVEAESPLVQLALVDLVLRNGNREQVDRLYTLAKDGHLLPELAQHVFTSLQRETA